MCGLEPSNDVETAFFLDPVQLTDFGAIKADPEAIAELQYNRLRTLATRLEAYDSCKYYVHSVPFSVLFNAAPQYYTVFYFY